MKRLVSVLVCVLGCMSSTALHAAAAIPKLVSTDQKLAAFVDGKSCEAAVRVRFQAGSEAEFDRATGKAARFIGNVTDLLKSQCPVLERVSVKGQVKDRIMYSGVAEAATDWVVIELGSRSGSGILSQGQKGKGDEQKKFAAAKEFVAAPSVLETVRTLNVECVGIDSAKKTCLARNRYAMDGTQLSVSAEYLLDKDGTLAIARYRPAMNQGFLCTDPNQVQVEIRGGKLTADGRAGMKDLLVERLRSAGSQFCSGFAGTLPGKVTTQSFGADGSSQAPAQPSVFSRDVLDLRIES